MITSSLSMFIYMCMIGADRHDISPDITGSSSSMWASLLPEQLGLATACDFLDEEEGGGELSSLVSAGGIEEALAQFRRHRARIAEQAAGRQAEEEEEDRMIRDMARRREEDLGDAARRRMERFREEREEEEREEREEQEDRLRGRLREEQAERLREAGRRLEESGRAMEEMIRAMSRRRDERMRDLALEAEARSRLMEEMTRNLAPGRTQIEEANGDEERMRLTRQGEYRRGLRAMEASRVDRETRETAPEANNSTADA